MEKNWETYEEVAAFLLGKFSDYIDLSEVEGKQKLIGNSQTEWEVDAKGINVDDGSVVLIECKCYSRKKIEQSTVAQFAYTISDTKSSRGIIVTPIGFQKGASIIAKHENIALVKLNKEASKVSYFIEFLNQICIGFQLKERKESVSFKFSIIDEPQA